MASRQKISGENALFAAFAEPEKRRTVLPRRPSQQAPGGVSHFRLQCPDGSRATYMPSLLRYSIRRLDIADNAQPTSDDIAMPPSVINSANAKRSH